MSKRNKKRNKKYQGEDAAAPVKSPSVRRYTAVQRGPVKEWLYVNKKRNKVVAIITAIGTVIVFLIVEAVRAIF